LPTGIKPAESFRWGKNPTPSAVYAGTKHVGANMLWPSSGWRLRAQQHQLASKGGVEAVQLADMHSGGSIKVSAQTPTAMFIFNYYSTYSYVIMIILKCFHYWQSSFAVGKPVLKLRYKAVNKMAMHLH
jgi:hypothetical protein